MELEKKSYIFQENTNQDLENQIFQTICARDISILKSSYPKESRPLNILTTHEIKNFLTAGTNRIWENIQKIPIQNHEIQEHLEFSIDDILRRKHIFYMLGCFGTTPIHADIIRANGRDVSLRIEVFHDAKNDLVAHLSLLLPSPGKNSQHKWYFVDYIRRSKVCIAEWPYKNPYTKQILWAGNIDIKNLHSDIPIIQSIIENIAQKTDIDPKQFMQDYIQKLQRDNTRAEYANFSEEEADRKQKTWTLWNILYK